MRHLNNGTDHRHSKSCCDQSSPACRTINWKKGNNHECISYAYEGLIEIVGADFWKYDCEIWLSLTIVRPTPVGVGCGPRSGSTPNRDLPRSDNQVEGNPWYGAGADWGRSRLGVDADQGLPWWPVRVHEFEFNRPPVARSIVLCQILMITDHIWASDEHTTSFRSLSGKYPVWHMWCQWHCMNSQMYRGNPKNLSTKKKWDKTKKIEPKVDLIRRPPIGVDPDRGPVPIGIFHWPVPGIYMKPAAYDGTTTSGTQPWKNMTTMGYSRWFDDNDKMSYEYILWIT